MTRIGVDFEKPARQGWGVTPTGWVAWLSPLPYAVQRSEPKGSLFCCRQYLAVLFLRLVATPLALVSGVPTRCWCFTLPEGTMEP